MWPSHTPTFDNFKSDNQNASQSPTMMGTVYSKTRSVTGRYFKTSNPVVGDFGVCSVAGPSSGIPNPITRYPSSGLEGYLGSRNHEFVPQTQMSSPTGPKAQTEEELAELRQQMGFDEYFDNAAYTSFLPRSNYQVPEVSTNIISNIANIDPRLMDPRFLSQIANGYTDIAAMDTPATNNQTQATSPPAISHATRGKTSNKTRDITPAVVKAKVEKPARARRLSARNVSAVQKALSASEGGINLGDSRIWIGDWAEDVAEKSGDAGTAEEGDKAAQQQTGEGQWGDVDDQDDDKDGLWVPR